MALRSLVLVAVPVGLALASVAVARLGAGRPTGERLSPYECGFEPTGDARVRFDALYYVVGILFLLFDLEVALVMPYCVASLELTGLADPAPALAVGTLLGVLTLGFVYEWVSGALRVA